MCKASGREDASLVDRLGSPTLGRLHIAADARRGLLSGGRCRRRHWRPGADHGGVPPASTSKGQRGNKAPCRSAGNLHGGNRRVLKGFVTCLPCLVIGASKLGRPF